MSLLKQINEKKAELLWAEAAALLHDLGKLSKAFLDYRKDWRGKIGGYFNDPHEQQFLKTHDRFIKDRQFPNLNKWLIDDTVTINGEIVSISDVMDNHVDPSGSYFLKENSSKFSFLQMIKAADAKDASIDRNNPLFSAGQKGDPFDTDVFGMEHPVKPNGLETRRECLYKELSKIEIKLPDGNSMLTNKERREFLKVIEDQFDKAFSDTTRPNNDTSLWEHCYAVASIVKVLMVHELIYDERITEVNKIRFGIMGIGWDGLSIISSGHKISDIIGRKDLIDSLKEKIRDQVEYEFFLGNTIYEDDNGIYFLIPRVPSQIDLENMPLDGLEKYGKLLQELRNKILETALEDSCGDIYPRFHFINDTAFMSHLVNCIIEVKKKAAYPLAGYHKEWIEKLNDAWPSGQPQDVCPICRRRPGKSEKQKICDPCQKRRSRYFKSINDPMKCVDTPFISEIARGGRNKVEGAANLNRAALIVAKIGIEPWLSGRMIRTLFVTEAKGLEKELKELGQTKDFETDEIKARRWLETSPFGDLLAQGYDYGRICKEIDLSFKYEQLDKSQQEYADKTIFLYGKRIRDKRLNINATDAAPYFKEIKDSAVIEYGLSGEDTSYLLYNTICAKTPTPSTILDIWNSTEKFFSSLSRPVNGKILGLGQKKRWIATLVKTTGKIIPRASYEGRIGQKEAEFVWPKSEEEPFWIVGDIDSLKKGDEIFLDGEPFDKEAPVGTIKEAKDDISFYYPLRVITTTPDIFMAIVPARDALRVTSLIFREYRKRFGKVIGRLPLSIGNIFFQEKMPMFVVLDSGRRMIRNFEKLHTQKAVLRVSRDQKPFSHKDSDMKIMFDEITWPNAPHPLPCRLEWRIPCSLGDESTAEVPFSLDYYHPYLMVQKDDREYSFRKNYFKTVEGDVIHCTEVQPGDKVEIYPGCYDFEFLDSNARRHDIAIGQNNRRFSSVTGFEAKPCLLDEMRQKIICTWKNFKDSPSAIGITDTKLRNLQSLWLTKYQEWQVYKGARKDDAFRHWLDLVSSSIKKELQGLNKDSLALLQETIGTGLFFETLELYYGIMKEKIDKNEMEV